MTTSNDNDSQQRVINFFSVLKEKLKSYREVKQHLDRFLSTDFNVFKWIEPENKNLQPDQIRRFENRRSTIIADLLRDKGSHGQQRKFLDAFLQVIGRPDLKDKQLRKVDCEVTTKYGRIDILVEFDNFGVAIENKPWATEQPEQLQRYYEFLNEEYGTNGFCLVFLTLDGHEPNSIEPSLREKLINERKLVCVSYSHDMREWIEECCRLCESDKFRWFLRDFMDHLNGGQTMSMGNEKKIILEHALEEKYLETALDINSAFNGNLHGQVIVGFLNKLEKSVLAKLKQRSDGLEWVTIIDTNHRNLREFPLKQYQRFGFGKTSWEMRFGVALEPQDVNAHDVIMGVWRKYNQSTKEGAPRFQPEDRLRAILNDRTERTGEHNDWWEWYSYLNEPYRSWGTDHNRTIRLKLQEDEAVEHVGKELVQIIKVAAPIIDEHVRGAS